MQRRTSLKLLGAAGAGIAGLALIDWKWQIIDRLTHVGFFTFEQEQLLTSLADTLIPEGIAGSFTAIPSALSTGTDQFLIRFFENCLEKEEQKILIKELKSLEKRGFASLTKQERNHFDGILEGRQGGSKEILRTGSWYYYFWIYHCQGGNGKSFGLSGGSRIL